jgi:shikimate dehydrogenase
MAQESGLIRLALFGSPVARSLSPRIHHSFAQQTGLRIEYQAIDCKPAALAQHLRDLAADGGRGCNITVPLKHHACRLANRLSARARQSTAVNTLRFDSSEDWFGDNTDGSGLVRDLRTNLHIGLSGRRIAILGAGGAAAGILFDLLQQGPAQLVLANRTPERARELAQRYAVIGQVQASGLTDLPALAPFDLVINATSAGHQRSLPALSASWFAPQAICYDLNYGAAHTVLAEWCKSRNIACHSGLGMLVEQAAESFTLWTGQHPDTATVISELAALPG